MYGYNDVCIVRYPLTSIHNERLYAFNHDYLGEYYLRAQWTKYLLAMNREGTWMSFCQRDFKFGIEDGDAVCHVLYAMGFGYRGKI